MLCDGCGRDADETTFVHFSGCPMEISAGIFRIKLMMLGCFDAMSMPWSMDPAKARLCQIVSLLSPNAAKAPVKSLWGMPPGDPFDDYAVMESVLPIGPLTEWFCRRCDTPYAVVANPEDMVENDLIDPVSLSEQ